MKEKVTCFCVCRSTGLGQFYVIAFLNFVTPTILGIKLGSSNLVAVTSLWIDTLPATGVW